MVIEALGKSPSHGLQTEDHLAVDEDVHGLTPRQLEEFCQSTNAEIIIAPESAEQDVNPLPVGDQNLEQGAGVNCEPVVTLTDDHASEAEPLRQSQRTTRPRLRMTYDALGQPSFQPWATAGVQGVCASHLQRIPPSYTVPWLLQLVWQPCCNRFVYMHLPVQFQPMTYLP